MSTGKALGGRIAIGERITEVQATFKKLYNLERSFLPDGAQFDHLFRDGEFFRIGDVQAQALLVPGHTPADMAYIADDAVFVGDTLFTAAAIIAICSGVVPQHPPTILSQPFSAHSRNCGARVCGVSGKPVGSSGSGSPALGWLLT